MKEKYKCVLSIRVAKELVAKGFDLVDMEPSRRYPGKIVFVFRNSPELDAALAKFERKV